MGNHFVFWKAGANSWFDSKTSIFRSFFTNQKREKIKEMKVRDKILHAFCGECGDHILIAVNSSDYSNWRKGETIETAFPYLSLDERDLLLYGSCTSCSS
jgi:hypothetical protein